MELPSEYFGFYGALAVPGKENPGFAVLIGMDYQDKPGGRDIYVLDEHDSPDLHALLQWCFRIQEQRRPKAWIGDCRHTTIRSFLPGMNEGLNRNEQVDIQLPAVLSQEYQQPYSYMLPYLKDLNKPDHKTLFLGDSQVTQYLNEIGPLEMGILEFGAYPAIEALAFAVIEMRKWEEFERQQWLNPPEKKWDPLHRERFR